MHKPSLSFVNIFVRFFIGVISLVGSPFLFVFYRIGAYHLFPSPDRPLRDHGLDSTHTVLPSNVVRWHNIRINSLG